MKIFMDVESTGINPYCDEIITAYFLSETGEEHLLESQVDGWSEEAEKIHGISHSEMMTYPYKQTAWDDLIGWLPESFELIVYANPQTQLGYLLFDEVIFKMHLLNHKNLNRVEHLPFNIKSYSVHSLAKECHKMGLFETLKNEGSNRHSFKQEMVFKALFDRSYDAHNAKADVEAMIEIYNELSRLKESGSVANNGQLSLI